jgi:hypothetical protein|tara:strand:+ start:197 stop:502 length:306 start_codon:yes stop_codon:yes gene_type:complete
MSKLYQKIGTGKGSKTRLAMIAEKAKLIKKKGGKSKNPCDKGYQLNKEGYCVKSTGRKVVEGLMALGSGGATALMGYAAKKATQKAIKKSKPKKLKIRRVK